MLYNETQEERKKASEVTPRTPRDVPGVKFYQVGGCVRDELLGIKSKDIDFSVEAPSFDAMCETVLARGSVIKVEQPEFGTIRAVHPTLGGVDFVLCRKESKYSDGRHPDSIEIGTLKDDIFRRDFTVNGIVKDEEGKIIDLVGGKSDLDFRILRCIGNTRDRMTEDALRMMRAIRFYVTKGFTFSFELGEFLSYRPNAALLNNVSIERIRDEILKCFEKDTLLTLSMLERFPAIRDLIFSRNLKLVPTIFKK